MPETKKRTYTKKANTAKKATNEVKTEKLNAKKPGRKPQSLARVATKTIARTAVRRTITGIFGNGLLGTLLGSVASYGVRQTDKIEYNQDFGMFHKK